MTWIETLLTRWLPRRLASAADSAADLLRASTMPSLARRVNSHHLAPLARLVLSFQMQRAANPALAHVVARLGVEAVAHGDALARGGRRGDHALEVVGALAGQMLVRLTLDGEKVTGEERLLQGLRERIRDVRNGPDGALYLVTDNSAGRILKVVPAK